MQIQNNQNVQNLSNAQGIQSGNVQRKAEQQQPTQVGVNDQQSKTGTVNQVNRLEINDKAIAQLDARFSQQQASASKNASYDEPSKQNLTAVAAYEAVGNEEQRNNIQQVFGVDLFA